MYSNVSDTSHSTQAIRRAITLILGEIDELVDHQHAKKADDMPVERLERLAKALSVHIKTLADLEASNLQAATQKAKATYLRYEDYPAPTPEDNARFLTRLTSLIEAFEDGPSQKKGAD